MGIVLAVYLVVALVTIEIVLIYARIKFEQPCMGREDLIGIGGMIALIWPIGLPVFIVWCGLVLICSVFDYLWRVEL